MHMKTLSPNKNSLYVTFLPFIYGSAFSPSNLREFFPYRCSEGILEAANAVIIPPLGASLPQYIVQVMSCSSPC